MEKNRMGDILNVKEHTPGFLQPVTNTTCTHSTYNSLLKAAWLEILNVFTSYINRQDFSFLFKQDKFF